MILRHSIGDTFQERAVMRLFVILLLIMGLGMQLTPELRKLTSDSTVSAKNALRMGAFISMKEYPKNKRILLDIGLAGPFSGLVVAIPVLLLYVALQRYIVQSVATTGLKG